MADITVLVERLEKRVQDNEYPLLPLDYEEEILSNIVDLGYTIDTLPPNLESLVLLKGQVNLYYMLSGKHAKNYRVRIEGDMEIHSQQVAENYLKLALKLEERLDKEEANKIDTIEMIEASRWRVSDNRNVPSTGGGF